MKGGSGGKQGGGAGEGVGIPIQAINSSLRITTIIIEQLAGALPMISNDSSVDRARQ